MTPRLIAASLPLRHSSTPTKKQRIPRLGALCVVASLGAHGALLALVLPASPPDDSLVAPQSLASPPLEAIAVTVQPRPLADPTPTPATPPPTQPIPTAPPSLIAAPPAPPALVASQQASQPEPVPPASEPAPFTPPPPADNPPPEAPSAYLNFPHLEGAQAACEGLADCWRSPVSSSWRSAAGDLQARLEAQGYTLDNVTGEVLSIDSGVRVYAVSKPGEPNYYLNLVSVSDGILYTMTAEPMTSDQVRALQQS